LERDGATVVFACARNRDAAEQTEQAVRADRDDLNTIRRGRDRELPRQQGRDRAAHARRRRRARPRGITANVVSPGFTDTDLLRAVSPRRRCRSWRR